MITLRKAQRQVLEYAGGRMAVSAVPGSGKTTTLSYLAATLIADGCVTRRAARYPKVIEPFMLPPIGMVAESAAQAADMPDAAEVLVVTFSNAAVSNFRSRIAGFLAERSLPRQVGYDVRTLHSLAHKIVQDQPALSGLDPEFHILDDTEVRRVLGDAVRLWIERHEERWLGFLDSTDDQTVRRWRTTTRQVASTTIRTAKTARLRPADLVSRLSHLPDATESRVAAMGAEMYLIYQDQLDTRAAVDFDDLVWLAFEQVRDHPDVLDRFRRRWPYILEDEAQDSSPLQEALLELLVGPGGNWVRVGDPNQAINTTFTSADPRFFRRFSRREDVAVVTLDQSGRSSEQIIHLANELVQWVCHEYPEPDIRDRAFELQRILPVDPGDPQPNPPPDGSAIMLTREYPDWQSELGDIARRAHAYAGRRPDQTLAILLPTNAYGHEMIRLLRALGADFDELLQAQSGTRMVITALAHILDFAVEPSRAAALRDLFANLVETDLLTLAEGANADHIARLLGSVQVEGLLFPEPGQRRRQALPPRQETTPDDHVVIDQFAERAARWARASTLPVDEFVLTVGADIFVGQFDLTIVQQVASLMRKMTDDNPSWKLPALAGELHEMAFGRGALPRLGRNELGFEPQPGRITVATMHGAKGLEWDLVYMAGVDRQWFPELSDDVTSGALRILEGDIEPEVSALVRSLSDEEAVLRRRLSPTDEARRELIAERLRLLYVGITRARRNLCISWSERRLAGGGMYGKMYDRQVDIAPVLDQLRRLQRRRLLRLVDDDLPD